VALATLTLLLRQRAVVLASVDDYQEVAPPGRSQTTWPYYALEMRKVDVLTAG
jgi:hypothetical protein